MPRLREFAPDRSARQSARTARRHSHAGGLPTALAAFALSALTLSLPFLAKAQPQKNKKKAAAETAALAGLPHSALTEDQAIVHALNRLGYGPRPGDIEAVKQMGLEKWIDRQLHPETIDDSALESRLQMFSTLSMSSENLLSQFPDAQEAARRQGVSLEEYRNEQQRQIKDLQAADLVNAIAAAQSDVMPSPRAAAARKKMQDDSASGDSADMPPPVKGGKKAAGGIPADRLANFQVMHTPARIVAELAMAKMDRAVYSERQLNEQMVDFWFNHFNVFAGKGVDRWLLTSYERDAIRPNAMGKFRDLLEATAKSPAMLFYLDNWQSVDPQAWARLQEMQEQRRAFRARAGGPFGNDPNMPGPDAAQAKAKKQDRGLNENYGREIMELHTLGVDGGYTQKDVTEIARCFTGWTIRAPRKEAVFEFQERLHDNKPKIVLGHRIDAGGMKDGEQVLDLLARDPHTAHHISFEIARHFVSDNPPDALVSRMAETFEATDGDIRAVLHTMIVSPEFWSKDAYRAKIKTPFELVASAARAAGAEADLPLTLVQWSARIGEPLYQAQPPTGYSDKASEWVNTGALLNRMNYSLTLASGRMVGVRVDAASLLGTGDTTDANAVLDRAVAVLLSGEASPQTRETLEKQMSDPQVLQASLDDPVRHVNQGMIVGLVLGSPEFQRR